MTTRLIHIAINNEIPFFLIILSILSSKSALYIKLISHCVALYFRFTLSPIDLPNYLKPLPVIKSPPPSNQHISVPRQMLISAETPRLKISLVVVVHYLYQSQLLVPSEKHLLVISDSPERNYENLLISVGKQSFFQL